MNSSIASPAPNSALPSAIIWINDVLLGSLAVGLCVIAISLVGLLMLLGELPIRQGVRVVLGCFILVGAPEIATGLAVGWQSASTTASGPVAIMPPEMRDPRPTANYDPYAGASLRRE